MQIGNCVGAGNHRHFILFLMSAVISTIYVSILSVYAGLHIWPEFYKFGRLNGFDRGLAYRATIEVFLALLRSAVLLSTRGLVLVYLFIASVSVQIGLSLLLWQQLCYIYEGRTYLSNLSSKENDEVGKKDCQNLFWFFGCQYSISRFLPNFWRSRKWHKRWKGDIYISENLCHVVTLYYLFLGCGSWVWVLLYISEIKLQHPPRWYMKTFAATSFHGALTFIYGHVKIENPFHE